VFLDAATIVAQVEVADRVGLDFGSVRLCADICVACIHGSGGLVVVRCGPPLQVRVNKLGIMDRFRRYSMAVM